MRFTQSSGKQQWKDEIMDMQRLTGQIWSEQIVGNKVILLHN